MRKKCTCGCLKVARCVVTLRDEDVVIHTTLQWFIEWYWSAHEFLLNLAEPFEAGLEFEMVVARVFGYCGNNSDIVPFRTDVVRGRYDCDIDVYDNQLEKERQKK